ncbi:MAG: PEP-CTERM sorting domain-containing protein [Acidobacteria bacterium]|nr:PEP-CTERM sorting domain-containing protein [Acidobacteriota bacterium]
MTRLSASAAMAVRIGVFAAALSVIALPAGANTINFSTTVTDAGTPSDFALQFLDVGGAPLSGVVDVTASIEVTITDGGSDGASLTGLHPGGWIFSALAASPGTSLGVDLGTNCVVPAGGVTSPGGGTKTCLFSGSTTVLWPILEQDLTAALWFGLSGSDDIGKVAGILTVVPQSVPEPLTASLLGVALAGFALRRRSLRARAS